MARHLEPRIPEECLVNKLSYHFEEEIVCARRSGQVKTVGAMETLLASYEMEDYYQRSRRQSDYSNNRREQPNQETRPGINRYNNNNYNRSVNDHFMNNRYRNNHYQNNHYNSCKKTYRPKFNICKKELLNVVFACGKFRTYVLGLSLIHI